MNGALLVALALRCAGLALVAVGGGNALIPALHEQTVATTHWLSEREFAESVALAQAAPGPNILLLPLIGAQLAGVPGAVVALAAFLVPSTTLAVFGARLLARHEHSALVIALRWALRPVTAGLMLSAAAVLMFTAQRTWPSVHAAPPLPFAALTASVAVLAVRTKLNPLVWLAAAACLGALV